MKKGLLVVTVASLSLLSGACKGGDSNVNMDTETDAQIGSTTSIIAKEPSKKTLKVEHFVEGIPITAEYAIDSKLVDNWKFTQSSSIDLKLIPKNIPDGTLLMVNNVYSDVSIVASKLSANGVRQDSLNQSYSAMPNGGVDIDEEHSFSIPFQVEGINQNETSVMVINGYGGSDTYRITENILRNRGAYGAKLNVVWTIIMGRGGRQYIYTFNDRIGLPYKHWETEKFLFFIGKTIDITLGVWYD